MTSAALTEFRVGERVPGTDWVMRGVVGQGGMGVVLEVRKGRNLRAAMKILRPAFARSAEFETRFAEEVEVMARLRHPNIVEVWDCGVLANGSPFLLMELLTGRTIRAVARDKDMRFTADAVWKIVGQICAGLSYAHNDKPPVVHRDVKPENVFLHGRRNLESRVKLLDFGIAKVLDSAMPAEEVMGTPRYIAPEVLRKEPLSPKVDLYALAVLVYELLTQAFPWQVDVRSAPAVSEAHLKLEPRAPSSWKGWIPKSVDECLLRALSKNPERRQSSVVEFYEQLSALQVVDDGSAKYRTDATTVPSVETMARGRAATTDSNSSAEAEERAPGTPARGWLEAARSRVGNGISIVEVSSEAAAQSGREHPTPRDRQLDDRRDESEPDVGAHDAVASERAAPVDTPMTGASARRMEGRARARPMVLVLGSVVALGAATLGGWKAWHSATARLSASDVGPSPPPMALVPPAATSAATEEPWLAAPPTGLPTVEAAPAKLHDDVAVAPAPEPGRGVRRPSAPSRPRASSPPQASSNLDDVLFGTGDPPNQGRLPASRERVSPASVRGRSTYQAPGLDDMVLGSGSRSSESRTSTPGRPTAAATASKDERAPRAK
jgi:serine/threonine-protein kinase